MVGELLSSAPFAFRPILRQHLFRGLWMGLIGGGCVVIPPLGMALSPPSARIVGSSIVFPMFRLKIPIFVYPGVIFDFSHGRIHAHARSVECHTFLVRKFLVRTIPAFPEDHVLLTFSRLSPLSSSLGLSAPRELLSGHSSAPCLPAVQVQAIPS